MWGEDRAVKKSARHDCPLVDPCQPIYHPPSLEKANRAFDRWVRAVRWEVWTRRVARVLAPAGVPFAVLALLCALAGPCGWLPGEVALLSGGTSVLIAFGCLALSLLLREVARVAREASDAAFATYENSRYAATNPRSAHFMGGCKEGKREEG